MPCDTNIRSEQERIARETALKELEADIVLGRRKIVRNLRGEISIVDWGATNAAKSGWCEGCALRQIQKSGSWSAKSKLAAAGVTNKPFVAATHRGHGH